MLQKLWLKCLKKFKNDLSKEEFSIWILPLQVVINNNSLNLYAPNILVINYVKNNYIKYIYNYFYSFNINLMSINFFIGSKYIDKKKKIKKENNLLDFNISLLSKKYSFDNFIYSKSNFLAYKESINLCYLISKKYKILFLYSCKGLGKTHLINSIGNKINDIYKYSKKIIYLKMKKFINNFKINIYKNNLNKYRNYLISADVLLIDDINYLESNNFFQKEFLRILNYFIDKKCILVFTSCKNINNLNLHSKIISKFFCGLIIKINNIDFNIRYKFLSFNLKKIKFLNKKNIYFISKLNIINMYILKNVLNILFIFKDYIYIYKNIDVDFIKNIIYNFLKLDNSYFFVRIIQKVVSDYYKIRVIDLLSKFRYKFLVYPRQMSIAISRKLIDCSLSKLGFFFGVDHSTIIYSCKKINKLCVVNNMIQSEFNNLVKLILISKYEIFYQKRKNI